MEQPPFMTAKWPERDAGVALDAVVSASGPCVDFAVIPIAIGCDSALLVVPTFILVSDQVRFLGALVTAASTTGTLWT